MTKCNKCHNNDAEWFDNPEHEGGGLCNDCMGDIVEGSNV
jgi:hypothetical protein